MGQRNKTCQPAPPRAAHDDGACDTLTHAGIIQKTTADIGSAPAVSPLVPVPTVVSDDKPYLPDRGTNDCDKPGWCSGPSYDPVTVVTRVQIPLRAFLSTPTTSEERSDERVRRRRTQTKGLNPISRAQRPTGASTSDSGSNPAPGVFDEQHAERSEPFVWRPAAYRSSSSRSSATSDSVFASGSSSSVTGVRPSYVS